MIEFRLRFILIVLVCLTRSWVSHAQENDSAGQTAMSLPEAGVLLIEPSIGYQSGHFDADQSFSPKSGNWNGVALGLQALVSSNRERSLLVGFALQQALGSAESAELQQTPLGARINWRPQWSLSPSFEIGWNFGDTLLLRARDKRYSGDSFVLGASVPIGRIWVVAEGTWGRHRESGGFIYRGRRGEDSVQTSALTFGLRWPLEIVTPDWLKLK